MRVISMVVQIFASPSGEAISALDGLVKDAIETLYESGRVFERDAFEKKGLVEE
jgi:hypothetical protein